MCLIIFKWQPDQDEKLVLLGNRDEFYQRPSEAAHYWKDSPHILAGRDLKAGGTWLGISAGKRICTVTNYREVPAKEGDISRGAIPTNFLDSELSAAAYAQTLAKQADRYSGYNAVLYDGEQLVYTSNRSATPFTILEAGLYGVSNNLLDTPWPKLERAKTLARQILNEQYANQDQRDQKLLDLMRDQHKPEDGLLPDTGIGLDGERLLSSVFIQSPSYGTRTTSLVIAEENQVQLIERNYSVPSELPSPEFNEQTLRL